MCRFRWKAEGNAPIVRISRAGCFPVKGRRRDSPYGISEKPFARMPIGPVPLSRKPVPKVAQKQRRPTRTGHRGPVPRDSVRLPVDDRAVEGIVGLGVAPVMVDLVGNGLVVDLYSESRLGRKLDVSVRELKGIL